MLKYSTQKRRPAQAIYRLIMAQLLLSALLALVFLSVVNEKAAYSAMMAGIICAAANAYFTWRAFRYQGARFAKRVVLAFFLGEFTKLLIISVLFVLTVLYMKIMIGPFLLSFVMNIMVFWAAPFILLGRARVVSSS